MDRTYCEDVSDTDKLLEYWETYELSANDTSAAPDSPLESPRSFRVRPQGDRPDREDHPRARPKDVIGLSARFSQDVYKDLYVSSANFFMQESRPNSLFLMYLF